MDHFAGMDVSVKETSVCILDDAGKILKEVKVASEPQALLKVLGNPAYRFKRIGLEAGPLSQWLFSALAEAELPVICVETRHMQAVLKAQINKTRGIAQMMRVGEPTPHRPARGPRIHSITSSAATSNMAGTSMPSVYAVFRLMTNSKRVACSIGSSPGSAPFRILSTYGAERRHNPVRLAP